MDESEKELDVNEAENTSGKEPPIHWATKKERIIAWVLAVIVIIITLAYAYSIATGSLFRH